MDANVFQPFWILYSVCTCVALITRFSLGLRLLLVLMIMPTSITPAQMLGITGLNAFNPAFLVMVLHVLMVGLPPARHTRKLSLAFWLLIAVLLISVLRSVVDFDTLVRAETGALTEGDNLFAYVRDYLIKPAQYLFVILVASRYLYREHDQRRLLFSMSAAYTVACLIIMFQSGLMAELFTGSIPNIKNDDLRSTVFGGHPNTVVIQLSCMLFITLVLFCWGTYGLRRGFLAACVPILALCILICGSRASMLSLSAGAAIIALTSGTLKMRLIIGGSCIGAVLVGIALVPSIRDKAIDVVTQGPWRALYEEREDIWDFLRDDLNDNLAFGSGRHTIARATDYDEITRREGPIDHPHNAYFEIILDSGLIGLTVVLWLFWVIARRLHGRIMHANGQTPVAAVIGLCVLAAFCVAGLTGQTVYPRGYNTIIWLILALGTANPQQPVVAHPANRSHVQPIQTGETPLIARQS